MKIKVGNKYIGEKKPCFIIAEMGSNHNGRLSQAKAMIDAAKDSGADCVKFQSFKAEELVVRTHPAFDVLKKLELPEEWHYLLSDYCKKKKVLFASTPFYLEAVDILEDIDAPFYKIASGDMTYFPLIEKIAQLKKPILVSTGMAYIDEVRKAVAVIKKHHNDIVVLHCVSIYPPKIEDINLSSMVLLREKFKLPVGLSDHTRSLGVVLGAVSLGACVIERHFTLSRKMKGPDHPYAMEPSEFRVMVNEIRDLEKSFGRQKKSPTKEEMGERIFARRGMYAGRDIFKGETITIDKLSFLRPARYLQAEELGKILGRRVRKDIKKGAPILFKDLS